MPSDQGATADISDASLQKKPLVFISHDTRDADIAEAFSKLLSNVSAGVLKSFRSSDKKGNQGIEYGVEWYPEIIKHLQAASDVVCLLTQRSVDRPWILYEAGLAKGKLDTPVHGLALGIPLQAASKGPFAQFQNCDGEVDSLTLLVLQLVKRIPNSEPDKDVVRGQVTAFIDRIKPMMQGVPAKGAQEVEDASVAKLFEEVKVMFQDLPRRIERHVDPEVFSHRPSHRRGRVSLRAIEELAFRSGDTALGMVIAASFFKDDAPWIYDMTLDFWTSRATLNRPRERQLKSLQDAAESLMHSGWLQGRDSRARELEQSCGLLLHLIQSQLHRMEEARAIAAHTKEAPSPGEEKTTTGSES